MDVSGITWEGESIDEVEILRGLPADRVRVLSDRNGFILRGGAVPLEKVSSRLPRSLCLAVVPMAPLNAGRTSRRDVPTCVRDTRRSASDNVM